MNLTQHFVITGWTSSSHSSDVISNLLFLPGKHRAMMYWFIINVEYVKRMKCISYFNGRFTVGID
jgi:hypothetical protein